MSDLIPIHSSEHLIALVKSIVPRSFEKTFGGLATADIVAGFAFCTMGLTQTELNTGLFKVKETGYCPDPAVFAKWCKGLDSFDNSDTIADSYIGKHGALANIIKWLETNGKSDITTAEKQAYDATYTLWQSVVSDSDKVRAELAFKDHYSKIVADFITQRIACQAYVAPIAIGEVKDEPKKDCISREQALEYLKSLQATLKAKQPINPLVWRWE